VTGRQLIREAFTEVQLKALTRTLTTVAALAFSASASAQNPGDFTLDAAILLQANGGFGDGYLANGAGGPTVVWQDRHNRYVMLFETRLPQTDPLCPVGIWGIGYATSPDGINWTADTSAFISPVPEDGTYYSCVAAQPTALWQDAQNRIIALFKGEQDSNGSGPWGSNRFTGAGRIIIRYDTSGNVTTTSITSSPVLTVGQDFGFTKFVRVEGLYRVMYGVRPNLHRTYSAAVGSFGHTVIPVMEPGGVTWGESELFNPAAACDDTSPTFKHWSYFGGRTTNGGPAPLIQDAGWGKAISNDTKTWFQNVDPYFSWNNEDEWRHWDVLVVEDTTTDYLAFGSERDPSGDPRVRLAHTNASWDDTKVYDKDCP